MEIQNGQHHESYKYSLRQETRGLLSITDYFTAIEKMQNRRTA